VDLSGKWTQTNRCAHPHQRSFRPAVNSIATIANAAETSATIAETHSTRGARSGSRAGEFLRAILLEGVGRWLVDHIKQAQDP